MNNIVNYLLMFTLLTIPLVTHSAVLIEEVDDPLGNIPGADVMRKSMGAEGVLITYKYCRANVSEDIVKELKAAGDYKSITVVDTCPGNAAAVCEAKPPYFKYYYTDARRILDRGKAECDYVKGIWSATTEGKEAAIKKQKGRITVGEQHYDLEAHQLCSLSPIYPDTVTVRYQKENLLIQISAQQKDGKAHYCMFDYVNKNKSKTIHAEGDGKKCPFTYDGKWLKGHISTADPKDFKRRIDMTFDIECH